MFLWPSCMWTTLLPHTHTHKHFIFILSFHLFPPFPSVCSYVCVCVCVKGQRSTRGFEALVAHDWTPLLLVAGGKPKRVWVCVSTRWSGAAFSYVVSSSDPRTTPQCRFRRLLNVVWSYRKSCQTWFYLDSPFHNSCGGSHLVKPGVKPASPCLQELLRHLKWFIQI